MAKDLYENSRIFKPGFVKSLKESSNLVAETLSLSDVAEAQKDGFSGIDFTSFADGFKSTQQLAVDWSKFENHTFFDSAESKTNVAFDTLINYFPFDSSKSEISKFIDGLTGFEKWVYDTWPKNIGYLNFSGTLAGENPLGGYQAGLGTVISVQDRAGVLYPTLSKNKTGQRIIDPLEKSFSAELYVAPTDSGVSNDNQVILQKLNSINNHGFTLALSRSAGDSSKVLFLVSSGNLSLSASCSIPKGEFSHIAAVLERKYASVPVIKLYANGELKSTSQSTVEFEKFDFSSSPLLIGSGSSHSLISLGSPAFVPVQTYSGSIDELKIFHGNRPQTTIVTDASGTLDPSSALRLYFKFNEGPGTYENNSVVLDYSGNSLHSVITNYKTSLRVTSSLAAPVATEDAFYSPVLFPNYPDLVTLNSNLLTSASNYDVNNPNLITKLVPGHYLEEAAASQGMPNDGTLLEGNYGYDIDFPGGGKISSPQIIASILYMWAKFFDEIKLFIDQFGKILHINYDSTGGVADLMLPYVAKYYGFQLPSSFSAATIAQFLEGRDLGSNASSAALTLSQIQSAVWRRILSNMSEIIRSKGTVHSIKAIMRAAGINPDNSFRFREFGGTTQLTTNSQRISVAQTSTMLALTSSNSLLVSPFLSGSRVEPGYPNISGQPSDGLFTTASWTYEAHYKFRRLNSSQPTTMSLARFYSTGSSAPASTGALLANLVAFGTGSSQGDKPSVALFLNPSSTGQPSEIRVYDVDLFDSDNWYVSFGREIGNEFETYATSSYFLRVAKQEFGNLQAFKEERTLYFDEPSSNSWSNKSSATNSSGSYFEIGNRTVSAAGSGGFLNDTTVATSSLSRISAFEGYVGHVRFWSKALNEEEYKEHVKNFRSTGVQDPLVNYNFRTQDSGSFERLRIDATTDQTETASDSSGNLVIFDFSQNNLHISASNLGISNEVVAPTLFNYTVLNPQFDERTASNKIRVRGFDEQVNIDEFNSLKAPVRSIPISEPVTDDTRFSIEISSVRALNEDIVNILSSLEFFDNAIGSPELQFSQGYPDLQSLREVYFNRLTDRVNYKNLLEFYKWFDESLAGIVESLVPRNTKFMGINYVIESHMLERTKLRYLQEDIYLGENNRRGVGSGLFLQQIVGTLKRF